MIASIVGNYLRDIGLLTEEQLYDLLEEHRKVRVKLGTIAVAEGLMTQDEAERVNRLQAIMDMRFGDIAVEEGYLTEGQVETLLKKQGNAYLAFAQALENQQLMLVEQLEQLSIDFQQDNHFTDSDIDKLKSDDIDQILTLYLPLGSVKYDKIASVAVRTIMRLIDLDVCVGKGYLTSRHEVENGAFQRVEGASEFVTGIMGHGNALCNLASAYGQEVFNTIDEDTLDAVGEVVNCINGLVATSMESSDNSLELCPPKYSTAAEAVTADEMLVLPLRVFGKNIELVISFGDSLEMK